MSKVDERIKELRANGETVYSFSRIDVDCDREYFHTYVERKRGIDNIYTTMGTYFHDTIEKIVNKEIPYSELKKGYYEKLSEVEFLDIKFPNDVIKNSWENDMNHAVENLELIDGKVKTEKHVLFQVGKHWFHGYIDVIQATPTPPYVDIIDWKTSSKFSGAKLKSAGRQLLMYKLAVESSLNIPVRSVKWNMLKYMTVKWNQVLKSGKLSPKSKMVSRGKWVKELRNNIKKLLIEMGEFEEFEIEMMLDDAVEKNSLDNLPTEIQETYTFEDCYVEYEATEERMDEVVEYVNGRIEHFNGKDKNNKYDWDGVDLKTDHDTFYCANLCGHRKHCEVYQNFKNNNDYRDKEKKEEKLDDSFYDLF